MIGSGRGQDDFAIRRRQMVERQLIPRGIKDPRVLDAMGKLPRHLFVEEALQAKAYSDNALPIGARQTISQPYIVALMTELLKTDGGEKVLEIGTGSGYQTALLAMLSEKVFSIERLRALSNRARTTLRSLGLENVRLRVGDGTAGWPEEAPFTRIIVTAGAPVVPGSLSGQLAEGGRMVIPVGDERLQEINVITKDSSGLTSRTYDQCVFVKLIGEEGWKEGIS